MPSARERANHLAYELRETRMQMKAAEIKARQLADELAQAMVEARSEAEAERRVVTYPTGRYECASCGQVTLFTEPTRELPACANCGNRNWVGHEPTVTEVEPPPPKKYTAGMYQCKCGARIGIVEDTDELSPCELCGATEVTPIEG